MQGFLRSKIIWRSHLFESYPTPFSPKNTNVCSMFYPKTSNLADEFIFWTQLLPFGVYRILWGWLSHAWPFHGSEGWNNLSARLFEIILEHAPVEMWNFKQILKLKCNFGNVEIAFFFQLLNIWWILLTKHVVLNVNCLQNIFVLYLNTFGELPDVLEFWKCDEWWTLKHLTFETTHGTG